MPYYSIQTKSTTSPCLRWRRQVYLLLAHILGKLTAKPVDGSQGNRVPAPKSFQCQWGEGDAHWGTSLRASSPSRRNGRSLQHSAQAWEARTTKPAWSGLTTVTSKVLSWPLVQKGIKTSAGRSSLPGRRPAGSFTGQHSLQPAQLLGRLHP